MSLVFSSRQHWLQYATPTCKVKTLQKNKINDGCGCFTVDLKMSRVKNRVSLILCMKKVLRLLCCSLGLKCWTGIYVGQVFLQTPFAHLNLKLLFNCACCNCTRWHMCRLPTWHPRFNSALCPAVGLWIGVSGALQREAHTHRDTSKSEETHMCSLGEPSQWGTPLSIHHSTSIPSSHTDIWALWSGALYDSLSCSDRHAFGLLYQNQEVSS